MPAQADMLDRADFATGYQTAVAFDLSNENRIQGEVLALPDSKVPLSFLRIPFGIKQAAINEKNFIFIREQTQQTMFAYNLSNQSSSLEIASFTPVFSDRSAIATLSNVGSSPQPGEPDLYFIQDGLQRLFFLRLPPAQTLNFSGQTVEIPSPDLVAVRLPADYVGRTFPSGHMFDPDPIKSDRPTFVFAAGKQGSTASPQTFRVRYDLPQPDWASTAVRIGLKALAIALPVLLIVFTDPDKLDRRRYLRAAIILGLLYLAGYCTLIVISLRTGQGLGAIIEDASFAVLTAFFAWLTYFLKNKRTAQGPPPPQAPAIV